jgi:hypothetical protein
MKDFNKFEKQLIAEIVRLDKTGGLNVVGNILHQRFDDHTYYIEVLSPKGCQIHIRDDHVAAIGASPLGMDRIKEIVEQTTKDLFMAVKLFEYLEKENLIYTYTSAPLAIIGPKVSNANYVGVTPLAIEIEALVRTFAGRTILPTQSLIEMNGKRFISDEELRFRKTTRGTQIAMIVSTLATLIALAGVIVAYRSIPSTVPDAKAQANMAAIGKSMDSISTELIGVNATLEKLVPRNPAKIQSIQTNADSPNK